MGYKLHIIRQNDYDDENERSNITLEEWIKYVQSDNQLNLTNGYHINFPGQPGPKPFPWFDFGMGNITAKYPDKYTIGKMIKVAQMLNAKVIGDDGEYWNETYFTNGGYATNLEHRP